MLQTPLPESTGRHSFRPRREDFKRLVAIATPVVIVQLGLMAMGAVDIIMVGHYAAADLAATALGNLYVFGSIAFSMGLLAALDPIVSQAYGARDMAAVGRAVQRGLIVAFIMSVPTCLVMIPSGSVLALLGQPAALVPLAELYVRISTLGMLPVLVFMVFRQSLQSMSTLRPIVITIVVANVLNVVLTWMLVFGHFGMPTRGTEGAAIATVISRWALAVVLLALAWPVLRPALMPFRRQAYAWPPLVRMFKLGAPIGVQYLLEYGVFAVVALFMGRLGTIAIAAHQVAINIASLMFMVPLGVSTAAAVLVGQAVGAGEPDRARRAASAALIAGLSFMALSAITFLLIPEPLARIYSKDAPVIALAVVLIPIAGVFQVFDGLQVVSIGVLRGVGDTRTPMVVNVLGFWLVGFPVSLWLGFKAGFGPAGLWWGLVAGLGAVALILLTRVRARMRGPLERMVIEEEHAGAPVR